MIGRVIKIKNQALFFIGATEDDEQTHGASNQGTGGDDVSVMSKWRRGGSSFFELADG